MIQKESSREAKVADMTPKKLRDELLSSWRVRDLFKEDAAKLQGIIANISSESGEYRMSERMYTREDYNKADCIARDDYFKFYGAACSCGYKSDGCLIHGMLSALQLCPACGRVLSSEERIIDETKTEPAVRYFLFTPIDDEESGDER